MLQPGGLAKAPGSTATVGRVAERTPGDTPMMFGIFCDYEGLPTTNNDYCWGLSTIAGGVTFFFGVGIPNRWLHEMFILSNMMAHSSMWFFSGANKNLRVDTSTLYMWYVYVYIYIYMIYCVYIYIYICTHTYTVHTHIQSTVHMEHQFIC